MQMNVIDKNGIFFERWNCSNEQAETFSLDTYSELNGDAIFEMQDDHVFETILVG